MRSSGQLVHDPREPARGGLVAHGGELHAAKSAMVFGFLDREDSKGFFIGVAGRPARELGPQSDELSGPQKCMEASTQERSENQPLPAHLKPIASQG
jgi:hypothetical protein